MIDKSGLHIEKSLNIIKKRHKNMTVYFFHKKFDIDLNKGRISVYGTD